jgi:hypothetical protein
MNNLKRAGWILIGVLIGGLAGSSMAATKAQLSEDPRIKATTTMGVGAVGWVSFVRDSKSNGCWVVVAKDQGVAVAVAPAEACN